MERWKSLGETNKMMKRNRIALITCTLIALGSIINLSAQESIKSKLLEAYKDTSGRLIKNFFEDWENEVKPISNNEFLLLSDTDKVVYKVFNSFCNYVLKEYPNKFKNVPYYMIQNEIEFSISKSNKIYPVGKTPTKLISKTIKDFRPFLKELNKKLVYVSPIIESALDSFVTNHENESPRSKGFFDKPWPGYPKANFLSKLTQIRASLIAFHFYTLPYIVLLFNNKMDEVIINTNIDNIWLEDYFIIFKGEWVFKKELDFLVE